MDLVGKTVRWEHEGRWFTANVTKFQPEVGVWDCVVVDPGTFRFWEPGHETYFGVRELVTVIDSEPYTEDEECE
jgi:hypothetical protein